MLFGHCSKLEAVESGMLIISCRSSCLMISLLKFCLELFDLSSLLLADFTCSAAVLKKSRMIMDTTLDVFYVDPRMSIF